MSLKILFWLFFALGVVESDVVKNVYVINYKEYMMEIIGETIKTVEDREWCNLKLKDFSQDINEEILDRHLTGKLTYTNGFVASIQDLNVLESMVQLWKKIDDDSVQVELNATLRMVDVALGFDVLANVNNQQHHYTGIISHPLITFVFSVIRNAHTHELSIKVSGETLPKNMNTMKFLPLDDVSDVLTHLYDPALVADGVAAWAPEVLLPIAQQVIATKVPFPGLCYNCAL